MFQKSYEILNTFSWKTWKCIQHHGQSTYKVDKAKLFIQIIFVTNKLKSISS